MANMRGCILDESWLGPLAVLIFRPKTAVKLLIKSIVSFFSVEMGTNTKSNKDQNSSPD
jgi:hypothetical protein